MGGNTMGKNKKALIVVDVQNDFCPGRSGSGKGHCGPTFRREFPWVPQEINTGGIDP